MNPILLTHSGKLGDFLYCLPIAEWFYQVHGRQTHWVLTSAFAPFRYLDALLRLQPHCANVSLVDHPLANLDAGGQPYQFDPAKFGIEGEYFNLGFRSYPTEFISAFYAREHNLGWINGYRLQLWPQPLTSLRADEDQPPLWAEEFRTGTEILRSSETAMEQFAPQATPLPRVEDLLVLARRLQRAREFHSWYCGLAVLAWFAGIPQHIYRVPGHAPKALYFPDDHNITWHEVTL